MSKDECCQWSWFYFTWLRFCLMMRELKKIIISCFIATRVLLLFWACRSCGWVSCCTGSIRFPRMGLSSLQSTVSLFCCEQGPWHTFHKISQSNWSIWALSSNKTRSNFSWKLHFQATFRLSSLLGAREGFYLYKKTHSLALKSVLNTFLA